MMAGTATETPTRGEHPPGEASVRCDIALAVCSEVTGRRPVGRSRFLTAGMAEPVEEPASALGPWVASDELPELIAVVADEQVRQLVYQHIVQDPGGNTFEPVRDADRTIIRCTRAPADPLSRAPAHRARSRPTLQKT